MQIFTLPFNEWLNQLIHDVNCDLKIIGVSITDVLTTESCFKQSDLMGTLLTAAKKLAPNH